MDREKLIAELTANCECWKGDGAKTLNALTDAQLEAVARAGAGAEEAAKLGAFVEEVRDAYGIEESVPVENLSEEMAKKLRQRKGKGQADPPPAVNGGKVETPQSHTEYLERYGTEEEKATWNRLVANERRERERLVAQLGEVAKGGDAQQKAVIANVLKSNPSVETLQNTLALAGAGRQSGVLRYGEVGAPSFLGATGPVTNFHAGPAVEPLNLPAYGAAEKK